MGIFDRIFGKNHADLTPAKEINSRYTFEMLTTAYNNISYYKEIAMLTIPINNPNANEVEIYFHTSKEIADLLILDFFKVFPNIDVIVQDDDMDNYDMVYLNICDTKVEIGYFGNKVNTNFDVTVVSKDGQWYCSQIGMQKFEPPKQIQSVK